MDCIDYADGWCDWKDMDCAECCGEDPGKCGDYEPREKDIEPMGQDLFT